MPKIVTSLTVTEIKKLKPKEKLYKKSDGGGLSLWVYPSGNKSWVLSLQKNGRRQETRKPFVELSLAEARLWREEAKQRLAKGEPIDGKSNVTFSVVFLDWHRKWKSEVSDKYSKQVKNAVIKNVFPVLGKMDVANIRPVDVVESLKGMEKRGALEYLKRTKVGVKMALDYAVARGLIDMNPAISVTPKAFKKPESEHFRALPPNQLPTLIEKVENGFRDGKIKPLTYCLIYWQLLTLARPGQAVSAEWRDIDDAKMLWIVPAGKMKKRREHIVPITSLMMEIIMRLQSLNVHGQYLFEGNGKSGHMSSETVRMSMTRLGIDTTAHGFRSLARTYLGETGRFDKDTLSRCLSHKVGSNTDLAYDRSQYLDSRLEALEYWSQVVADIRNKVKGF